MTNKNPLLSVIRQPKAHISLPSCGNYWPPDSLEVSPTGEYAVYAMTARDEILLKTPDALLNGQAVVSVIENCVPAVKDAWQTPQIDLDTILIAIRIATYGETMDCEVKHMDQEAIYGVDLNQILTNLRDNVSWEERVTISDDLIVYVKPLNYLQISRNSAESFETQRILNLVNDTSLTEEQKIDQFRNSFNKLTDLTLSNVYNSVYRIDTATDSVTDQEHIREFVEQCDRGTFNIIKKHLDMLGEKHSIKPIRVQATAEMIAAGSSEEIEMPIAFDPSTFFA
jgi:hypothetical protein